MHTFGSLINTPILDEKGQQQSNALGCMIHYLCNAFIGNEKHDLQVIDLEIRKMILKNLCYFEEYFNHFIVLLFQLEGPLESKWTDLFLASLPPWFVQRLH